MGLHELMLAATATACFLFVFAILSLPGVKKPGTWILLAYVAIIGLLQSLDIASNKDAPTHAYIGAFGLLLGPLFYAYILKNTHHKDLSLPWFFLLSTPAILVLTDIVAFQLGLQSNRLIEHKLSLNAIGPVELAFVVVSVWKIYETKAIVKQSDTPDRLLQLSWLNWFCILNTIVLSVDIILPLALDWFAIDQVRPRTFINSALMLFLLAVAFKLIRQPSVIYKEAEKLAAKVKYKNSGLSEGLSQYYKDKLQKLVQEEQVYLNSDLTLRNLSDMLGLNAHNLSQLLNETLGCTYHDYINRLRVEHAKSLLMQSSLSALDVGFESGFNTKVAFYNSFKKYQGCTPGQWRKQQNPA